MILGDILKQCFLEREDLKYEVLHILSHIVKCKPLDIYFQTERELSSSQLSSFWEKWKKLLEGEPLAYVLKKWDFYGREFFVNSSVFIPRSETEELVEHVLKQNNKKNLKVVDFGSGTGCIGITLALEMKDVEMTLVESSQEVSWLIEKNIKTLAHGKKITLMTLKVEDIKLENRDIVVANPPYISKGDIFLDEQVRKHEPKEALFAGEEGFACIKKWSQKAKEILRNRGRLYMEIGHMQLEKSLRILKDLGYVDLKAYKDLRGKDRYICGEVVY